MYNDANQMSDLASQKDGISQRPIQAGHYLWVVLSLVTSAALSQGFMRVGFPVLYPFIQSEFGLSRAQVGLITSSSAAGFAVTVILAGWLTDTFGVKRIITVALLMVSAFILTFPLAYSYPLILCLVFIIGIVSSPIFTAGTRAVIDWFPIKIRALVMSIYQMGIPIAGALSAAALPTLAITTGWRIAEAVTGLLILVIAIAFILLYRNAPQGTETVHGFNLTTFKNMLQNHSLMMTFIWGAAFVGFQYIALSYFMLFLIEGLEWSPIMAGGLLAIAQFSSIIARVLWGAISDFIFHGRRVVVLALTGFFTVLWMLGTSMMGTGVPAVIGYLIAITIGISTMSFHGVLLTLIGEQAEPGQVGVTVGVASTTVQISVILMPPLFGYLVDVSGSYSISWSTSAALALVFTLALLFFSKEPQRR